MASQTYAVIGTGAVGGFYGAKLQKSGQAVHFLLRSDYDWVQQQGLAVHSPSGDFHLDNVNAYRESSEMPPCDVVIVALKSTQNHQLPQLLAPILKPNSTILVLQNGLNNESAIAHSLSPVTQTDGLTLVGGLCFLCSNKLHPGIITHLDYGLITLGQYAPNNQPAGITAIVEQLSQTFEQAGIPTKQSDDLYLERWKKLIWNIPFNGLSVVLNAQTNELMAHASTMKLVRDLMAEITQIAVAYGRTIPSSFIDQMLKLTAEMFPYKTSMKLDFDKGRAMEIETIFGNPLRAAQQVQVSTPKLGMLYQQLQYLNGKMDVLRQHPSPLHPQAQ
jgi:2-dehydropantoate 2-reductase